MNQAKELKPEDLLGEERELVTDEYASTNELVIVPMKGGFRVSVRPDWPTNEDVFAVMRGTEIHPSANAIDQLYEHLGADKTSEILVTPSTDGKSWRIAELPKDRDESVLISRGSDDDTQAIIARLYRAIGGEPHPEDEDWKLVEELLSDDELKTFVLPSGARSFGPSPDGIKLAAQIREPPRREQRSLTVKDLVDALFSIADALADMPGDPGRTVDLPARARAIREASDAARKGRR